MTLVRFIMIELEVLGLGAIALLLLLWGTSPNAEISIINESKQDIKEIFVVQRHLRTEVPGVLKPNEERTIKLMAAGESAYWIEAVFKSGKKITSHDHYVQSGFRCTDVIRDEDITNKTDMHGHLDQVMKLFFVIGGIFIAMVALPAWSWVHYRRLGSK